MSTRVCGHCSGTGRTTDDKHCGVCGASGYVVPPADAPVDSPPPTDGPGGDTGN